MPPTEPETNVQVLRERAFEDLRAWYEGLVHLYDRPLEFIQRTTTYRSRSELYDALMRGIMAAQGFASRINLLTVAEVRALYAEYRQRRPDIFGEA
jgi:hypothetical protein